MAAERAAEKLERYSDWLSGGAGAALVLFLGKNEITNLPPAPQLWGIAYIALSLAFGALAKFHAYTATAVALGRAVVIELDKVSEERGQSFKEFQSVATEGMRLARLRFSLLQRFVVWWALRKPDKLHAAGVINASIQYLIAAIFCQMLCIVGGVMWILLPAFLK